MEIQANSGVQTPASGQSIAAQSDYQTFLNMLTVQMRNQDPLNPQNATDFAVQLATFSGVEQQMYTNQLLSAMVNQAGLADLGSWVGMEARIYGGAWFEGDPVALTPDPALGADAVTLTVRDASGAIVDSRALEPGAQSYAWDGMADGTMLPAGRYTFEIESRRGGEVLDQQPVAAYMPIVEARYGDGTTLLVLPGGLMVDSGQVTGLRRPPPP